MQTMMHRRRACRAEKQQTTTLRSSQARVALNMPVQGTAADIMKLA